MVRRRWVSSMAIAAAAALPFAGRADDAAAPEQEPSRELGTVTVIGRRPSSLPTQIPTTIEGISGEDIRVRINATDAEDALKYFPSLVVRKRYIGDYDHAVLATRASGTNNSARSLVYVDGILISNLLGNGASFTPRWGLVTPEEIERVDVLYGPFSAAYPGNSVGAVVDYVTRMPDELELNARLSSFGEDFHVYRSRRVVLGTASERVGRQPPRPVVLVAELQSARQRRAPGQLCEQAREHRRARHGRHGRHGRAGRSQPARPGLADPGLDDGHAHDPGSREAQGRLRALAAAAIELHARLRGSNDAQRSSASYLRDAAGNSGVLGRDQRRRPPLHGDAGGLRADGRRPAPLDARAHAADASATAPGTSRSPRATTTTTATHVRSPTVALPEAAAGGAGRIADQDGTGWSALALRVTRRPAADDGHILDLGVQVDDYRLRTLVSSADDWLAGAPTTRVSAFRGDTELTSVYAQDTWAFAPQWRATLGARVERWEATNGAVGDATETLGLPTRTETYVSPKLALARQLAREWSIKASLGRAVRIADGRRALSGLDRVERHRQQRSEPAARALVDLRAHGRTAARARQLAAHGVLRGNRGCPLLADQRHGDAERHERAERRRDRHARPRSGVPSARPARRPAGFLDEPDVRAFADRGEREFPGERRQVAAARAGLARERARDVSPRSTVVADGRRPLQRHAVQHARQLRSERLRVHRHERVHRLSTCARATRASAGRRQSASTTSATRSTGRSTPIRGAALLAELSVGF